MDDKQNQTLIDYELLMKKSGGQEGKPVRAAAFGRYAGSRSHLHWRRTEALIRQSLEPEKLSA